MRLAKEIPVAFLATINQTTLYLKMKIISDSDNQEIIAQLLRNIRMTRIKLGVEC